DADELETEARSDTAKAWARRLEGSADRLLVRANRAEPSKNVVRGFEAFGSLLDRRPDLRDAVKFIACLYPSRQSMKEYRDYSSSIRVAAESLNDRYPDSVHLFMEDDFARTLGALSVYDVLLVNPLMDGMNLVSKEGPTINQKNGVLVLSAGAGSYEELGEEAVTISDARDIEETASALERAFDMSPEDRSLRGERLRKKIADRRPVDWIEAQLDDLVEIAGGRAPSTPPS
ncbi:MAG: trehalose-6-phosphate synthase, partial [Actinomycetota bacterium]